MLETPTIPSPRPLERHLQIEVDQFCECGYNLHGQVVTRDERLGFPVCRCPECGRWHAAGFGATTRSVWLGRLVTMVLVGYVLGLIGFLLLVTFFLGVCDVAYMESRRVTSYSYWNGSDLFLLHGCMAVLSVMVGVTVAVALWHVRARWRWIALLSPLVAVLFVGVVSYLDQQSRGRSNPYRYPIDVLPVYAIVQMLLVSLGLVAGRPLARVVLTLLVPPHPRQFLGFLWRADGLTPPSGTSGSPAVRGGI